MEETYSEQALKTKQKQLFNYVLIYRLTVNCCLTTMRSQHITNVSNKQPFKLFILYSSIETLLTCKLTIYRK